MKMLKKQEEMRLMRRREDVKRGTGSGAGRKPEDQGLCFVRFN